MSHDCVFVGRVKCCIAVQHVAVGCSVVSENLPVNGHFK